MSAIKRMVIGESTEAVIRLIFDNRAAQESNEGALNAMSRAMKIKELKNQVISFVKRNSNGNFVLEVPEYNAKKSINLRFTNFVGPEDDDDVVTHFKLLVDESFTKCAVTQKVELGKDIVLKLET